MTVGESISKFRKELGMTQQQLANRLCISPDLVSKWECGNRRPDYSAVLQLCEIFNVPAGSLIDHETAVLAELKELFSENAEKTQLTVCVNAFLSELHEKERKVFVMRYSLFLDTKTIADRLGISDNNVRKTLSRTRVKLKNYVRRIQNETG